MTSATYFHPSEKTVLTRENFSRTVYYNPNTGIQVAVVDMYGGTLPTFEIHVPCEGSGYRVICQSPRCVDKLVKWQYNVSTRWWAKISLTLANKLLAPKFT